MFSVPLEPWQKITKGRLNVLILPFYSHYHAAQLQHNSSKYSRKRYIVWYVLHTWFARDRSLWWTAQLLQLGNKRPRTFHILVKFMLIYREKRRRFSGVYLVVTRLDMSSKITFIFSDHIIPLRFSNWNQACLVWCRNVHGAVVFLS